MGVLFYNSPDQSFSDLYLKVREIEKRVYDDSQVKELPILQKGAPNAAEWKLRHYSSSRFINYLNSKDNALQILDIGCGNGWFSHLMSLNGKNHVTGQDINAPELEQAARVFAKSNLEFVYANLFEKTELNYKKFDVIVFNSCLQYFENLDALFQLVETFLTPTGEIHIIDTPFYNSQEMPKAKQRTQDYFSKLGFPEMSRNYFHHRFEDLPAYEIMHSPPKSFLKYFKKDSPFYWIRIKRKTNNF